MSALEPLRTLPNTRQLGNQTVFTLSIKVTVAEGSFLHVGGTPSPLTEKKQPVFSVEGQPVIPASSFKGAFRQQVEALFIEEKEAFAASLGLSGSQVELLKPSIPAPHPSKAEKDLFSRGYRDEHSEVRVDDDQVRVPHNGLCPVSYFFGATGLEGYLRISNFFSIPGEWRIDQTRIRIDRMSQTAAPRAIVTGEQVKPGSVFRGELLVFTERQGTPFGRCRTFGGAAVDSWLNSWSEKEDTKRQLFLLNKVLIPALRRVEVLGGQKSLGGGKVTLSLDET